MDAEKDLMAMVLSGIMMFTPVFAGAESEGSTRGAEEEAETTSEEKKSEAASDAVSTSECMFEDCTFMDNSADDGGVIDFGIPDSNCQFEDCTFMDNRAGLGSASFRDDDSAVNCCFEFCRFINNSANDNGAVVPSGKEQVGPVEFATNEAETGGAITVSTPTLNCYFEECTLIDNMSEKP